MDVPFEEPALLDVFTEIISDNSGQDTPYSTIYELGKYLNDTLIVYKTGDPYNW